MSVSKLEKSLGIEVYVTHSSGIGGVIRDEIEDFFVEEILADGSRACASELEDKTKRTVLGSSSTKNHYLLCVLTKRNWDTFIAIRNISRRLGISPTRIHIAGIKDAKAVTNQHITIEDVLLEDVQNLHLKDIELHPIGYIRNSLSPYYLLGNSFNINIRGIKLPQTKVNNRCSQTAEELGRFGGIPNFFGHQRFGTTRPITHLVGKAIIKGELKKAAMLFLAKPSPYEHPSSKEARQELKVTHNFKKALNNFPKQLRYERLMLKSLSERPDDFHTAFKMLPMQLRQLFVQACQSHLFNRFLSRRISNGLSLDSAEIGDYVINLERSGMPIPAMYRLTKSENISEVNKAIKAGKMRVAIPLVGRKQNPSRGLQGEVEREVLVDEGISPSDFQVAVMPETSSKGELRAILTPIRDLSVGRALIDSHNSKTGTVKLEFTLYRGSYATVVLREFMKPQNPVKAGF